jgi:hypothetical protein
LALVLVLVLVLVLLCDVLATDGSEVLSFAAIGAGAGAGAGAGVWCWPQMVGKCWALLRLALVLVLVCDVLATDGAKTCCQRL